MSELLQALQLITGARLRSVYIVWSDLFIVLERMKRKRELRKRISDASMFGELPNMSDLSDANDQDIDDTIKRGFYFTLSDNHIFLVDIEMSGLMESISLYDIIEIVILLDSSTVNDETLFSIAFHGLEDDEKDRGHSLFKCFRRKQLLSDLNIILSTMIMYQTLQLKHQILRYSHGVDIDQIKEDYDDDKNIQQNNRGMNDSKFFVLATPLVIPPPVVAVNVNERNNVEISETEELMNEKPLTHNEVWNFGKLSIGSKQKLNEDQKVFKPVNSGYEFIA